MSLVNIPNRDSRTRSQVQCDRGAVLGRAVRAARVMVAGMEQLDRGLYRVAPADLLALRTALAQAATVIRQEERSSK
jgi:hypothetical protein